MATPTYQDLPAKQPLPIEEVLARLASGDVQDEVVEGCSDLGLDGVRQMRARWPQVAGADRERLIRRAIEWAETDISKEFGRLYRIALTDEVEAIRHLAVIGLWEDQRPDLPGVLLDVAEGDPSTDVRAAAVVTLGGLLEQRGLDDLTEEDGERVRDLLLALAEDEGDVSILRRAAVEALGGLGDDPEAAEVIRFAGTDDDAAMQAAAIFAMGTTRDDDWTAIVVPAMASDDAEVRAAAVRAVGLIGVADAVSTVAELAVDEDDEVRHAAIAALGAIGDPPATRALRLLLQDPLEGDEALIEAALDEATIATDAVRGEPA